jgi:hypothetical protein
MGFWMVIGLIEFWQLVTTSKDYVLTVIHTSQITKGHTRSSQSVAVFTSRCLVGVSKGGSSPSLGFPNSPRPLLLASHSSRSQHMNRSSSITNSLTTTEAESELLYDWRFSANQFVLAISPLRITTGNFIFQLNTCGYSPNVTSSLMMGWICSLQLLLVLASAVILRSESDGTHDHILLSESRLPQPEGQVPLFRIPRNRVAQL